MRLYLEIDKYNFQVRHSIILFLLLKTASDFDAKPMVMLLGQYSTGKTTFIKHLLGTSYPGKAHENFFGRCKLII